MSTVVKVFVSPEQLRLASLRLAMQVVKSGFAPTHMIAVWRGGAPIGCVVHEVFKYHALAVDHIAIRTSRYTGLDAAKSEVAVHNLGYLEERLQATDRLLIVDDIWDSGHTIVAVLAALQTKLGERMPQDVRVATVYYKPSRNATGRAPDYYVHETADWIVFPHELEALTTDEIAQHMGQAALDILES